MEKNNLIIERKNKLKEWQKLGFDYAEKFDRTHTSEVALSFLKKNETRSVSEIMKNPQSEVKMCGRIMNIREMGKLAFLKIRDRSGDFQIGLAKQVLEEGFKQFLKLLDLGDFCGFEGEFFVTKHGEPSLLVTKITPLSKAIRPLPEKFHGIQDQEKCYRERNLDLATNPETFKRFKIRSQIVKEIRNFFYEKDFEEIETRILQPLAGGAMAKVFETHHNALDHDFVLRIALELDLKIACSGGMERVFEIGKNFRNEGTDPSHLQEFSMLEWYAAYKDIETNKQWTQDMIQGILKKVLGTTKVTVLDKENQPVEIDFGHDFREVRFPDLLKEYADFDMFTATDDEVRAKAKSLGVEDTENTGIANLLDDIYKKTARPNMIEPTFVLDYPEDLKPLAAPKGDGTANCFQLLVAGWEIVNAYGELIDPQVQRSLFERQSQARADGDDEAMELDEEFLRAMEHGFPPMTGNGMGIDRFVALITQQPNLRDVVLFPTLKPENKASKKREALKVAVVVLNESAKLENWQNLNSVAHLNTAFGARYDNPKTLFKFDTIESKDGQKINMNMQHAIIIKSAKTDQDLKSLIKKSKESNLEVAEFTREMLEFANDKKVREMTESQNYVDIEHFGVLIFGDKSKVDILTKGFRLMK